ncbi:MAG: hypothetical protein BGO78_09995 [Chloroflexi bacterium 44-23]|nr:MAG: hypothetical protein BGO78_09995 [Chloroflexi bacterium 44-23]
MGLLSWTIIGVLAGWLTNQIAKMPIYQIRSERMLAGLSGALTGGILANVLFSPDGFTIDFRWQSALIALFGAVAIIGLYFLLEQRKKDQTSRGNRNVKVEP